MKLLDYSPTGGSGTYVSTNPASPAVSSVLSGTNTNIGAGDFLYGEGGDDVVYGQTGDDTIFGGGQDDQLYGNAGNDWISGGTGDDGVLGDDGLLRVSRNGTAEPLFGLAATAQSVVTKNGDTQAVTVNITGTLDYIADLEPFFIGGNDIIYGGLGNDSLHGGAGDDAISGAEALPLYYDNANDPLSVLRTTLAAYYTYGNVLGYSAATTLFRYYNPNDPWRKIMVDPAKTIDFLLNFESTRGAANTPTVPVVDDGKDVIFGDVGNDWLVGGTNEDHLYGGYGNDLLNADDNLDSTIGTADPLANNTTDARTTGPTFADIGYGGAGLDVLIGNTFNDRLIDWTGEFNTYVIPYSPFGEPTVTRLSSPSTDAYLYAISKADGADPTRGGDATRNGEPYGEIGLVDTGDTDINAQRGSPRDPQNIKGAGTRDTTSLAFSISPAAPSSIITAGLWLGTITLGSTTRWIRLH